MSLKRRHLVVLSLFIIICLIFTGCGKPKVYRVGVLSGLDFIASITDGFKAKMTELGYIEGENIIYDIQKTDFDMTQYKKAAEKFVADKVDLIFSFPTEASLEAKLVAKDTNIPVVFNFATVEGTDLIKSVRDTGGNVTGVRYPGPDIAVKRFEIMRQLAPEAKRYLLPYQRGYPTIPGQIEALNPVAEAAGITLIEAPVADAAELDAELKKRANSKDLGFDAIMFLIEPLAVMPEPFTVMAKFAYERKIPIGGAQMEAGGYAALYGVNVDPVASGALTAPIVDKIFKGTKASTIPVVSAEILIEINYTAAQKMGIKVSEELLNQANRVIR